MDYGNILRRSWQITWQYKFMILLGFLASLGSGIGSSNTNYQTNAGELESLPFIGGDAAWLPALGALALGAFCFLFILGIAFWLLQLVAEAGLIDGAARLDSKQSSSFGEAMRAGWRKLGTLVGLNLVLFGGFFLLLMVFVVLFGASIVGAFAGSAAGGEEAMTALAGLGVGLVALFCCLLCGLILLGVVLGVVYTFAQRAVVLEDQGVINSIRRGWQVIRENLGEVVVLLIIFFGIGLLVGALTALIFIPLGIFSVGPTALRLFSGEQVGGFDIGLMILGFLVMAVIGAAIRSIYTAFQSSAFTLAFKEFTEKQLPAQDF